jgi:hypothetical protein
MLPAKDARLLSHRMSIIVSDVYVKETFKGFE